MVTDQQAPSIITRACAGHSPGQRATACASGACTCRLACSWTTQHMHPRACDRRLTCSWCSRAVLLCVACVPAEVHTALPSHSASLRLAKKMCSAAKVRGTHSSPAPSRHCAPAATAAGCEGPSLLRGILGLLGTDCFCTPVLKVRLVLAFPSHSPCRPKHSTSARPLYCALQPTPTCTYQLQHKQGRYPASSSCCLQQGGVCFGTSSWLD
jgi:hypothetical protein